MNSRGDNSGERKDKNFPLSPISRKFLGYPLEYNEFYFSSSSVTENLATGICVTSVGRLSFIVYFDPITNIPYRFNEGMSCVFDLIT